MELAELARQKNLFGGYERNRLHRATRNGAWLSTVPHHLKGKEFSREEFRENHCLRYGLIPQDISAACNGCGKTFSVEYALSFLNGGLVLARQDDTAKEWGSLG